MGVLLLRVTDVCHFARVKGETITNLVLAEVEYAFGLLREPHLAHAVLSRVLRRNEMAT